MPWMHCDEVFFLLCAVAAGHRKHCLVVSLGLWAVVGFVWFVVVVFVPSDCISLSSMTWAPCPHGVRTRGKKEWRMS